MPALASVTPQHRRHLLDRYTIASAPRHEVMFRDGSSVTLLPVLRQGSLDPDLFLRALRVDFAVLVFDLRRVAGNFGRTLEADVLRSARHDRPGVVFFNLRQAHPNAGALLRAIQADPNSIRRTDD